MTPAAYFASIGVFDVPTIAAHCVWCEDDDLAIMKEHGVFAALNPASNMKLGSGFAPVTKMLERGVDVCLGTDGMASNNNHDMFQDIYLMALLSKGYCERSDRRHAPAGARRGDARAARWRRVARIAAR